VEFAIDILEAECNFKTVLRAQDWRPIGFRVSRAPLDNFPWAKQLGPESTILTRGADVSELPYRYADGRRPPRPECKFSGRSAEISDK